MLDHNALQNDSKNTSENMLNEYCALIFNYLALNGPCTMQDLYMKLELFDIPMYLAVHELLGLGLISGIDPYEYDPFNSLSHVDMTYTVNL